VRTVSSQTSACVVQLVSERRRERRAVIEFPILSVDCGLWLTVN
jgi:hypothetical protein